MRHALSDAGRVVNEEWNPKHLQDVDEGAFILAAFRWANCHVRHHGDALERKLRLISPDCVPHPWPLRPLRVTGTDRDGVLSDQLARLYYPILGDAALLPRPLGLM